MLRQAQHEDWGVDWMPFRDPTVLTLSLSKGKLLP